MVPHMSGTEPPGQFSSAQLLNDGMYHPHSGGNSNDG